jgi:biopolymer transport protein ExbD/biopolymer transport protein TolR
MSAAGKKRRASLKPICYIDMTAFLSIQAVLLAMFMAPVISYPDLPHGPSTDLAKVDHPVSMRTASREDAMVVAVMRTGDVFFRGDKIAPEQLDFKIRNQLSLVSEKKIYINADARAKYGRVREVLEAVRSSGVERVGFLVERRKQSSLP